jgi:hypothetical protein
MATLPLSLSLHAPDLCLLSHSHLLLPLFGVCVVCVACAVDVISPANFTEQEIREAEENAERIRLLYTPPHVDDPPEKKKRKKDRMKESKISLPSRFTSNRPTYASSSAPPRTDILHHIIVCVCVCVCVSCRPSWFSQTWYLFLRAMQNVMRGRMILLAQLAQTIIFGVLIGTVFLDIGTNQAGQKKRLSVLFFVCINQGFFSGLILINSCAS